MGNTESVVASGVKKQAGPAATTGVYQFINVKGEGQLVSLMKEASKTKDYSLVEKCIKEKVVEQLYNRGEGRLIPIDHLIMLRNRDRPKSKLLEENRRVMNDNGDFPKLQLSPEDTTLDRQNYDKSKYRLCCYNLDYMGAVQEGILLLAMLNATSIHRDLARRLLHHYPRLINDVYLAEEYYGESALHIAIVNEDPAMVRFLLDHGIDVHQRCFGNFMSPEDQKNSRYDVLGDEVVRVGTNTNYEGYIYWGEYPLSFAACLGQEECYRLILSRGANPDLQDSNGNTTSHMVVIYQKIDMFNMVYECGADVDLVNRQGLTPLTLAAKLARKDIFAHIMQVKREINWQIGNVVSCAYPLARLDTFDPVTGQIERQSAVNMLVFGDKLHHLDMLDGVVVDLLNAKWNAYVRDKFNRMMFMFTIYFLLDLTCVLLRPAHTVRTAPVAVTPPVPSWGQNTSDVLAANLLENMTFTGNGSGKTDPYFGNGNESFPNISARSWTQTTSGDAETSTVVNSISELEEGTTTDATAHNTSRQRREAGRRNSDWCGPWRYDDHWTVVRTVLETIVLLNTIVYIGQAVMEAHFLGIRLFLESLAMVPSRVLFLLSCLVRLGLQVAKLTCWHRAEDILAVLTMLGTAPYYLFFCRGYKTVGPFVTMIYNMIVGDLLRFVIIYLVFVMGFSQAYFCIYRSFSHPGNAANPMETPMQSILLMFVASLSNFGDLYNNLKYTKQKLVGQILFILYMIIAAILLINMLIAMMGNTYQRIAEMKNEWMRQWARIVLVVERGVSPQYRLQSLKLYSRPMSDGRAGLFLRKQLTDDEMATMRDISEMKIRHQRNREKRSGQRN